MEQKTVIPSDLREARRLEEALLTEVERHGYSEGSAFGIKLALEEALNNAIRHGNGYDTEKTIEVTYDINDRQAAFTITDQGGGFAPEDVPDPTTDENLEKPYGRGIMLMRAYMDHVRYNPAGNEVYIVKRNV